MTCSSSWNQKTSQWSKMSFLIASNSCWKLHIFRFLYLTSCPHLPASTSFWWCSIFSALLHLGLRADSLVLEQYLLLQSNCARAETTRGSLIRSCVWEGRSIQTFCLHICGRYCFHASLTSCTTTSKATGMSTFGGHLCVCARKHDYFNNISFFCYISDQWKACLTACWAIISLR